MVIQTWEILNGEKRTSLERDIQEKKSDRILEQPHQLMQIFCLFCKKKPIFSILHIYFYKTSTSVYLFYTFI